jgi:mRNA-degrading endonuclease RelE of RelBE toxin-antitoxin system
LPHDAAREHRIQLALSLRRDARRVFRGVAPFWCSKRYWPDKRFNLAHAKSELGNLKKLKGVKSYFRLKLGDYRIGLALENNTLVFVRFLDRKDIYKYFP